METWLQEAAKSKSMDPTICQLALKVLADVCPTTDGPKAACLRGHLSDFESPNGVR